MGIDQSEDSSWILGHTFLSNFYTVWDNSNSHVGIAPHITSESIYHTTAINDLPRPTRTFGHINVMLDIAGRVIEVVSVLGLLGFSSFTALYFLLIYLRSAGILKSVMSMLGNSFSSEISALSTL